MSAQATGQQTQGASTKSERKKVSVWVSAEAQACGSSKRIAVQAVHKLPRIFTQRNRKSALEKARQWFKHAKDFLPELQTAENRAICITNCRSRGPGAQRHNFKALIGRWRKSEPCVIKLYSELCKEFCRLREARIKANTKQLRVWAVALSDDPERTISRDHVEQIREKGAIDYISCD